MRLIALFVILFSLTFQIHGQSASDIDLPADDGRVLRGTYHVPFEGDAPAVLLLHQMYTTSASWDRVIDPLLENGYRVLAVDLRGYGRTRGAIDWQKAQDDTQTWMNWLAAQPGVGAIQIMGSSMGANLGLVGCAQAARCTGAVALSPGLHYFGVYTQDALTSGKPALILYADRDRIPRRDVPQMIELAGESLTVQTYSGRAHGIDLLRAYPESLSVIIDWLNAHR
ncbi:MAG: hypothetical protein OHK0046_16350 [Anaerolineae bacterium]